MKASLGAIILNVAVIHGAGLVLLTQQQGLPTARSSTQSQVLHLRLAQATVSSTAEPAKAPPPNEVTPSPAVSAAPAAEPTPAPQTQAAAQPEVPLQPATEEYIPRPRLSLTPTAIHQVIVPFPTQFDGTGRYTSVLALYIDEDGIVRRVRFDDAELPPSMKDAAKQAFLQAHFQPGQVKGQVVKSLIHIQVMFDNTPITPDTSYTTL